MDEEWRLVGLFDSNELTQEMALVQCKQCMRIELTAADNWNKWLRKE